MSKAIVECVPNFSEARRPEVVEAIMNAITSVSGVVLLDRHSDPDHNRTVLTLAGEPKSVGEAAFRAIAKAAELIDLNHHTGEHPRIGATDVVPFIPVSGVSMEECIQLAQQLGERVATELGIPVYLYEEAATRPERRNLETIRRGQYEGLKQEIETNPERQPDFGPCKLGPAGATVIGARQFLIAFNVYLNTSDVTIAKKIAKTIRFSSGGLRYVKALGMLVEGLAQVSMNLTNFHETPIAQVVEMVRREAARYGVTIHHSELVGLIPQDGLVDAAVWYLQLDQFNPEQIFERRLEEALQASKRLGEDFLEELAVATPAPGGGSAAAYSAAAAAALVAMVARLTVGKKKYAEVEARMQEIIQEAETLRQQMSNAVQLDAAAFEKVMSAMRLPKETPEQQTARSQAIEAAMIQAALVPLTVARGAFQAMQLAREVIQKGNINAISDGGSAAAQAQAALTAAALNMRINLKGMEATPAITDMLAELKEIENQAAPIQAEIRSILMERGGL